MTTEIPVLLLVGSDPPPRLALAIALSRDFTVLTAPTLLEATLTLRAVRLDAILVDLELQDGSGNALLALALEHAPGTLRFLMAREDHLASEVAGCATVELLKPVDLETIGALLTRLVHQLGRRARF